MVVSHGVLVFTSGSFGWVQNLEGNWIDEWTTSRVLFFARVMDDNFSFWEICSEATSERLPTIAAIHGLNGDDSPVPLLSGWNHRDIKFLLLCTGSSSTERDGVEKPLIQLHLLLDGSFIAKSHCIVTLRHNQQHVTLFLSWFYVFNQPRYRPVGNRILPNHHRTLHFWCLWAPLEVPIWQQPWNFTNTWCVTLKTNQTIFLFSKPLFVVFHVQETSAGDHVKTWLSHVKRFSGFRKSLQFVGIFIIRSLSPHQLYIYIYIYIYINYLSKIM